MNLWHAADERKYVMRKQIESISSHNPTSDLRQKLIASRPQASYWQQIALSRLHAACNKFTCRLQVVNDAAFGT